MKVLVRYWQLTILWALSLAVVSVMSSSAQTQRAQPGFEFLTVAPTVVSGNDVGFRIERTQDGVPVGKVVVRVNGVWVDTLPPR
jgi:hypothetical protein